MRRGPRWMRAGFALGIVGFLLVTLDVLAHGFLYRLDTVVYDLVSDWAASGGNPRAWGEGLSLLGDGRFVALVVAGACLWMLSRRHWVLAVWCVALAVAAVFAVNGLKLLFHRARPPLVDVIDPTRLSFSFPSGHTIGATAGLGSAIILATESWVRTRAAGREGTLHAWAIALGIWAVLAFLTGVGRVLAQKHWVTDVVASWCLGLALASGLLYALSRKSRGGDPGPTVPEKAPPQAPASDLTPR